MTITRRIFLSSSSAAIIFPCTVAIAQSIPVPGPEEVWAVLKGERREFVRMLAGVDALARILVLRSWELKPSEEANLGRWLEIRLPFNTPAPLATIQPTREAADVINGAGKEVLPTAVRIEKALADGGLAPGSQLEKDMLRGFILFVQIKAVADRKVLPAKQAWYCEVYPFSVFCPAAG
jgi:hypothetical protein